MDGFNYLQVLNDDNELLQAEDLRLGEFPTFSVHFVSASFIKRELDQ